MFYNSGKRVKTRLADRGINGTTSRCTAKEERGVGVLKRRGEIRGGRTKIGSYESISDAKT